VSPAAPPPRAADPAAADRTQARTLAVMLLVGALGALVGAVAPMTDQAPVTLNAVLAGVGLVLTGAVLRGTWTGWSHVGALAVVGGVTAVVAVAATPEGAAGTAISYLWVPVFAAFFFSGRFSVSVTMPSSRETSTVSNSEDCAMARTLSENGRRGPQPVPPAEAAYRRLRVRRGRGARRHRARGVGGLPAVGGC